FVRKPCARTLTRLPRRGPSAHETTGFRPALSVSRWAPARAPRAIPTHEALTADTQEPCDGPLAFHEPRLTRAACWRQTSSRGNPSECSRGGGHLMKEGWIVTVLCVIQGRRDDE